MLTKERVIAEINKFPDEFTVDELMEKLILIEKINIGREQSKRGDVVSDAQLDYEIKKWLD
jgi:hypothetical protein